MKSAGLWLGLGTATAIAPDVGPGARAGRFGPGRGNPGSHRE